jgi:hypothetical protein
MQDNVRGESICLLDEAGNSGAPVPGGDARKNHDGVVQTICRQRPPPSSTPTTMAQSWAIELINGMKAPDVQHTVNVAGGVAPRGQ